MKLFFIKTVILALGLFLGTSCEDEIDTAQPGSKWNTTYVTVHPKDYLTPLKTISLPHSKEGGIKYDFSFQFILKTSKPVSSDVAAQVVIEHNLPIDRDKIVLSSSQIMVKAGESQSNPVSLCISDWSDLENFQDKQEYNLQIKVEDLLSREKDIALGDYYRDIKLLIVKQAAN